MKYLGLIFISLILGCGYTFQHAKNPRLEREGIERIYIAQIENESLKPGINAVVHNSLIKVIQKYRRVKLAPNRESADAILEGIVSSADTAPNAITSAKAINPKDTYLGDNKNVATEYRARLACIFTLKKMSRSKPGEMLTVWSDSFDRSKPYPGNAQVGTLGKTTGLINESEFDRALLDLSELIMDDVHEMMLALF